MGNDIGLLSDKLIDIAYAIFMFALVFVFVGIPGGIIVAITNRKTKNKEIKKRLEKLMVVSLVSGPVLWVISVIIIIITLILISLKIIPTYDSFLNYY